MHGLVERSISQCLVCVKPALTVHIYYHNMLRDSHVPTSQDLDCILVSIKEIYDVWVF